MSTISPFHAPRLPAESPDAKVVAGLAAGLAAFPRLWPGRVGHDGPTREAVRLLLLDRYEAWVIAWPEGHATTPHDHGDSLGALVVVEGELFERIVDHGRERRRALRAGDGVPLPAGIVHDV